MLDFNNIVVTMPLGLDYEFQMTPWKTPAPANSQEFSLKRIEGLEPPDFNMMFNVRYTNFKEIRTLQERRGTVRQIIMTIGLYPNFGIGRSYKNVRSDLYALFGGVSGKVRITLRSGTTSVAYANAYLSNFESDLNKSEPDVTITFDCESPYLTAPAAVNTALGASTTFSLTCDSQVPVGFSLVYYLAAAGSTFSIQRSADTSNAQNDITRRFVITYPFLAGDIIRYNSVDGTKNIIRQRGSDTLSMLPYISVTSGDSPFFHLKPRGTNPFVFNIAPVSPSTIGYTSEYFGV